MMVSFASIILIMVLCSGYLPMSLCTVECVCQSPAHQRSHHCLCCVVVAIATRLHVVTSPPWLLALPLPQMMANTQVVSVLLFSFFFICPCCLCLFSSCLKILFHGEFVSLSICLCLCVCLALFHTLSLSVCVSVSLPPPPFLFLNLHLTLPSVSFVFHVSLEKYYAQAQKPSGHVARLS